MDCVKVQFDVKNNAQDLQNFVLDLKGWESEMKRKDAALSQNAKIEETNYPPPRNKIKKKEQSPTTASNSPPKKISAYDYSSWDKFDVDKACEEVDKEDDKTETPLTEQQTNLCTANTVIPTATEEELIDQAFYEKEQGNRFVKQQKWDEAIKCYTKAIACDPTNPVFYANRGLCFLKLKNFKASETDSTTAIQLDPTYVKAFQRRATARQCMGQLEEAKIDFNEVLKLEPKNSLALSEIIKIDKKLSIEDEPVKPVPTSSKVFDPKVIFENKPSPKEELKSEPSTKKHDSGIKATVALETSTSRLQIDNTSKPSTSKEEDIQVSSEPKKTERFVQPTTKKFGDDSDENIRLVYPVKKSPHMRSKKPLKRITIEVSGALRTETSVNEQNHSEVKKTESSESILSSSSTSTNLSEYYETEIPGVPRTAVQFRSFWKKVKLSSDRSFSFLKQIPPQSLPNIFENSMESDIFSDLVQTLSKEPSICDIDVVHSYLRHLTHIKRFRSLVMFMTSSDKSGIEKCLNEIKSKLGNEEEVAALRSIYEL